jgi:hypothetical protein
MASNVSPSVAFRASAPGYELALDLNATQTL